MNKSDPDWDLLEQKSYNMNLSKSMLAGQGDHMTVAKENEECGRECH